jgi:LmbE family N-acetylglucosaminyl deacetylase
MTRFRYTLYIFLAAAVMLTAATPPTPLSGSAELQQTLERLNVLGSVMMLAAHPDDENTAVLTYFARGRHIETIYVSATRGEGGQNLIGTEQGELMGLIRTQELLGSRRIDGAQQFFTRAIDFGYSKTPDEALGQWGREVLLADMVRAIRRFRPDVIIARFPPPPGSGGHGQHTAVGYTGEAAMEAAADPSQFPEQIAEGLEPWKAKRYYYNVSTFRGPAAAPERADDRVTTEIGGYNPILGKSYGAIAGEGRSLHRSQGFGAGQPKGARTASFDFVAGERVAGDLFADVDTSWERVADGERVGDLLAQALGRYEPTSPTAILPLLLEAYHELEQLEGDWPERKRPQLLHAIELATGLWLDAAAERWDVVPGEPVKIELTTLNRSAADVRWLGAELRGFVEAGYDAGSTNLLASMPVEHALNVEAPADLRPSQPPWLVNEPTTTYHYADPTLIGVPEAPPIAEVAFRVRVEGVELEIVKPVVYRWVDRARGERERSVLAVPAAAVSFTRGNMVFPDAEPRRVSVRVQSNQEGKTGRLVLDLPDGWAVTPAAFDVALNRQGQESVFDFEVTPPAEESGGQLVAQLELDGASISTGMRVIEYDHIPIQVVFPRAAMRVERIDVVLLSKNIGYVMGAGDEIPAALEQLGATVRLLDETELATGDLSGYDTIISGVRALQTRADLMAARERVMEYVAGGGTFVVQYNTITRRRGTSEANRILSPYPIEPYTRQRDRPDRITDENSPVEILLPEHPLLNTPNKIRLKDFDGWVQERGLYFMEEWDPRYTAPWTSHDVGQPSIPGGTLYATYGKGTYVYTAYSWFRHLPKGVPGAYRIFANIVSAGKTR